MKKLLSGKWLWLTVLALCVAVLFHLLIVPLWVDHDTRRAELGPAPARLPAEYTREQAIADGCIVKDIESIVAGKDRWNWFRFKTVLRIPSAIRIYSDSLGEYFITDLAYDGREYVLYYHGGDTCSARYLKYSKAINPYGTGYEAHDQYYLSTAADGTWNEYINSLLSASGDMPDYTAYLLFMEKSLP